MEYQHQDQELKLSVIIKNAKEYFWYLLKLIWLIVIAGLILGAVLYYIDKSKPLVHKASLKFMLADDGAQGGDPLSGMLGQFGLGGGGKKGANLSKMQALLTTQKIIKKTMFETVKMGGKDDFLANHYIDKFKLHDTWAERGQERLAGFYFKSSDFENFDRQNHSISNFIYAQIAKFTLNGDLEAAHLTSRFDDSGTDIVDLHFTSTSDEYSLVFLTTLYDVLSHFYVSKSIAKQEDNYKMAKKRADSLKTALDRTHYQIANFKDTNRGLFKNKSRLKIEDLERESYRLKALFTEAARNFEVTKIALQSKTPFITPIDMPLYPISAIGGQPWKRAKFGFGVGAFLMVAFLIAWKFLRDILKKEEEEELKKESNY